METLLSVVLLRVVCGSLVPTVIFHGRLPGRRLYRSVVAQLCAFPGLGFLACVSTASVAAILHARGSFRRPRYVQDGAISPAFADGFGVSAREIEVASLVLQGLDNAAIGEKLFIPRGPWRTTSRASTRGRA